ncbi:hypothetical protein SISNIDRAFT_147760 [Sistotremastrum niveocremeum HHB9708]|uniref:MARVEL domain-containing protein n=2 Tax=Sistotremastraceae TaxID=3402574 RepID=A0A165A6V1_9AGAM|nr:hypothetical protein SISNIDRAFT_147760 [Sistotremastrum niveocremeum HHB9708]KZT43515.1 hypothetical protein SISSUDRAFT_1057522 [Sistotremastrum suecicum HHB10207 ss-3]
MLNYYHTHLFTLIALVAMAEMGLTSFLINRGNLHDTWFSARYHHLLILALFNSVWTTIFAWTYVIWILNGAMHLFASIAGSALWLLITAILWGTAGGVIATTRGGGDCNGDPPLTRCRQSMTVMALCWTEFGLCLLTLFAACMWVSRSRRDYRGAYYVPA